MWRYQVRTPIYRIAMLAVMLMGLWCVAQAEDKPVVAEGVAAVVQRRIDMARDQALEDALRKTVEQAVGTLVEAETSVQKGRLIDDLVRTGSKGYVKSYRILSERQNENIIRVAIEAVVDMDNLETDLAAMGLLYQRVRQPRLMVMVLERHAGRLTLDPAGETEIIQQLIQKGIRVVDQAQTQRIRESDQVRKALQGDKEAARQIGLRYDAEILIIGEASSEKVMQGGVLGNMVSARARLDARAIRTDTGEILAADGQMAASVDLSEQLAGRKALTEAGGRWIAVSLPVVLDRWARESSGAAVVQLVVNGLSLRQLTQFEGVLKKQFRGIKEIYRKSFDAGVAIVDVELAGTGQGLADALSYTALEGFDVAVTTFSPHRLKLSVRQRK
jgi:hypothetical protein